MFKNKSKDGKSNICGRNVYMLRISRKPRTSQQKLAHLMQIRGVDVDKNAVQRIESGQRFVTDIELKCLSEIFGVSCDELLTERGRDGGSGAL
ncbi:MAG: helix-turn-helix domain-containing protein [Roseburia sp.]|nr:helix-turn-helix domain-containing protein [Roseburia sp.]